MTDPGAISEQWAPQQLAEFLAVISNAPDPDRAIQDAVDGAAEAVDAEVAAAIGQDTVLASIGFPDAEEPVGELLAVAAGRQDDIELAGLGRCHTLSVPIDHSEVRSLLVARHEVPFEPVEIGLVSGMARVLELGLRMLRAVERERGLRTEADRQASENARLAKTLQYRIELEQLIMRMSRRFVMASLDDLDDAFARTVEEVGRFLEVSLVSLHETREHVDWFELLPVASWTSVGPDPDAQRLGLDRLLMDDLTIGAPHQVLDLSELPTAAHRARATLDELSAESSVLVPLGDLTLQYVLLAVAEQPRTWSDDDLALLRVTGEIAMSALARRAATDQLEAANEQLLAYNKDLAEMNEQLREASRLKDHLLSVTTHELRTPLTSIMGFSETLMRDGLDVTDARTYVEVIHRQSQRLLHLVSDLLDVSRLQTGRVVPDRTEIEVLDAVRQWAHELGVDHDDLSIEGEPALINIDAGHLAQIVQNLVSNARKYGAPPITLTVQHVGADTEVAVSDRGDGVDPEFVPQLFDAFTQASTGTRRSASGTGLGLAIVKSLAEVNGCEIRYEPNEPTGARFVLRVPGDLRTADDATMEPSASSTR